jgi:LysR family transcriptional regulator, nitrogen assimilation regulatory protein
MDLKQLESFVRVAELGSFSRAAIALGLAQPLLSRHVRQLEVDYRQSFLRRNGRGVTLTEAGLVLLEHGRGILHQVALAKEELGSVRGALAGRVSIGLPPSLSKLVAVPLTRALKAALPHAQLTLTEGFSLAMYEGLRAGRLDMAVLYNVPSSPELESSLLHQEPLLLISAANALVDTPQDTLTNTLTPTVTLSQLAALPLIVPSRPNAFRLLLDAELARLGLKPTIALEIDGLNAILDLVKEGLGHAVLPRYTLRNLPAGHGLITHDLTAPPLLSSLSLVWSARRPSTATHQAALRVTAPVVQDALRR